MKRLQLILLILILQMPFLIKAQTDVNVYQLDLTDTTTYNYDCGSSLPSKWSVINNTCTLRTSKIYLVPNYTLAISASFVINRTGNMEAGDTAFIAHAFDGGTFITDTVLAGDDQSSQIKVDVVDSATGYNHVHFMVIFKNDDPTEEWWLKSSGLKLDLVLNCDDCTLPIELGGFSASLHDQILSAEWNTFSEVNHSHFELQYGLDAENFESLLHIESQHYSTQLNEYEARVDFDYAQKAYVRLKSVDYDGSVSYSPVLIVGQYAEKAEFRLWKSGDGIMLSVLSEFPGQANMQIIDLSGRLVYQKTINWEKGSAQRFLNITAPPEGIYLVRIIGQQSNYVQKLVF